MRMGKWKVLAVVALIASPATAQDWLELPDIYVTTTRLDGGGITGASTTVITAEEIERSPQLSLPDILAREAGIQTQSTFGTANGAGTIVDMRGFGAAAPSNVLVLINGRRLNDWDLQGVDFAAIARNAIERIEVTRGNSGAVLYGDGAVGGVINIVTKAGASLPPSARVEGAFGSFNNRQVSANASGSKGAWSAALVGEGIENDGYRVNNALRQRNGVADLRYSTPDGSAFLTLSGDSQRLGFPGSRLITLTMNEFITDPRGTNTPNDFGEKHGYNITTGFTHRFGPAVEMIVDGSFRHKTQFGHFFGSPQFPFFSFSGTRVATQSLTPRANINTLLLGLPTRILAGLDIYRTDYDSDRAQLELTRPYHRYDLSQTTVAGYWQQTVAVTPSTDVAVGYRLQRNSLRARDTYDPTAPGGAFLGPQGIPLDASEWQQAAHLGVEHRLNGNIAVFGRVARSFRVPNVDERIGSVPFATATNFNLRTQTSYDIEGGVRFTGARWSLQTSVYDMRLRDELRFNLATFANENMDPTHRRGVETLGTLQLTDTVRLKGALTHIRATYRSGPFAGNDVPAVSRWSGSVTASADIVPRWLVADAVFRFASKRRLDADDTNTATFVIPAFAVLDLRIGGEAERMFWSFAVQNVFDRTYVDFGAVFGPNFYSVYPLPGRTFLLRAGLRLP